jgi:hypothetical protein
MPDASQDKPDLTNGIPESDQTLHDSGPSRQRDQSVASTPKRAFGIINLVLGTEADARIALVDARGPSLVQVSPPPHPA